MNKGKKISSKAKEKKAEVQEKKEKKTSPPKIGAPDPPKKDTKGFEQLMCGCCSKQLWVKSESSQLVPGCSCALYLPGHAKCSKCSLHCTCEGRTHG